MKYTYVLSAMALALMSASQMGADAQSRPTVYNPGVTITGLSDNGAYAIGSSIADENVDNPRNSGGTIIELSTKKQTTIPAVSGWADINDVADNGTVVGSAAGRPGYWTPATGKWTTFNVPSGWGGGAFTAVTPDAHYAVGYLTDPTNEYVVAPMMYDLTTGEQKALTNLPKHDLTGEDQHQNVFYGISPDGRYALGQMSQSYWMPVGLFTYIYDTVEDTWRPIAYTYDEATGKFTPRLNNFYFTSNQYFSCDGNWVTGSAYMVFGGGDMTGGSEGFYPYRYNVAEDKFEVFTSNTDNNVAGNKITADGTLLGASPADNPYPSAVIRRGNFFVTLDQIIEQVYGMRVYDLVHDYATGSFAAISADGLTAVMRTYDNSYVLTMPESFADAASKVDLLANYSLNIPEGSSISRISEIKLTFERAVDCMDYAQGIRLLDGQGKQVRAASGFMVSPTNDHTIVVTFRSTSLTPQEQYTVDIPEGMIWLKDDHSVKSKSIQIKYKGREEGPISVVRVTPVSGASIAEFNTSPDNLSITFDTPVAISEKGSCTLYNADDNSVLGAFTAVASGNTAVFSPLGTYHLYKGSKYKVVIAAGTVTDLSGAGANQEIVLEYNGTYVRQISSDDLYLFRSTCDNYEDFIFWKDEFNEPSARPAGWGFTEETPWVLVRQSEETTDMALAAHSMFTTPAESDSWLIIPQTYIPDANTFLSFDAQSYMRNRDDNLKVYIYCDDASYNYFNADLKNKFLTDGDLALDETVSAGATDEGLEGEWTRYKIALDKYAGNSIYVAFVYKNFNKSAIFIDNVQVMRDMNFLITNQTAPVVVNADKVTVSGLVSISSEITTFNGININLRDEDGEIIAAINDEKATLKYGDTYKFSFDDAIVTEAGTAVDYTIEVISGQVTTSFTYTLKNLTFQPTKRVILEEFTGSQCSNCPLGIRAIQNLESLYPDNFIPLTLRTYGSDMYAAGAGEYTSFLGLSAAPSGRINRGNILMPTFNNGSAGIQFFGNKTIGSDGEEIYIWGDAVRDELDIPAEAEVSFTTVFDANTGDISVPCNINFALNRSGMSLGVFAVVVEDKLPTYQDNGYYNVSDPALGEWGVGGLYGSRRVTNWLADDVVRYVVNDRAFNGTMMPQSDFSVNTDYTITLEGTIPAGRLTNPDNCKVVVMLIDRTTGKIINASRKSLTTGGINDIITDGDGEAEYYNLNGIKVTNPAAGQIYIRVVNGKADKVVM